MSNVKTAQTSAKKPQVNAPKKSASINKVDGVLYVSAEAKPNEVKRALGVVQSAKIEANNDHKYRTTRLNYQLASYKIDGVKHLKALNDKHKTAFKMSDILKLEAKDLAPYMTEGDKKRQANNGNQWKFWMVEGLIAKYLVNNK